MAMVVAMATVVVMETAMAMAMAMAMVMGLGARRLCGAPMQRVAVSQQVVATWLRRTQAELAGWQ